LDDWPEGFGNKKRRKPAKRLESGRTDGFAPSRSSLSFGCLLCAGICTQEQAQRNLVRQLIDTFVVRY
jgi:hypothetical protein